MLNQAKIKLKSLIFDDSGIAMAYTIMVFLLFFMLCVSAYAMSTNIRQKMELQYACDAAAYSGAVVQADMLSRLAVLNRALSWTYLETNKRHMDYTVDDWLQRTVSAYDSIATSAQTHNASGNCGVGGNGNNCAHRGRLCWFAGSPGGNVANVQLNRSQDVPVATIRRAMGGAFAGEQTAITNGYSNIAILNREINTIRTTINASVGTAVNSIISQWLTTGDTFDYHLDGNWRNTGAATYIVPQRNEAQFINYANTTRAAELARGTDVWWNLTTSSAASWWSGGGFSRNYNQAANSLVSRGVARARRHWHFWGLINYHSCGFTRYWNFTQRGRVLLPSTPAAPARLDPSFFGAPGTILVAAKRPVTNPFLSIFGSGTPLRGLYAAFNGSGQDMWAVSTARAGIRLGGGYPDQEAAGNYHILYPGATSGLSKYAAGNGTWNLCEEDWDAVMIPVDRAWHNASLGAWAGAPSAANILTAVQNRLRPNTTFDGGIQRFMRH